MSQAYVIEVAGQTAGIVVNGENGFRFFSSTKSFDCLDGLTFRTPVHATKAAAEVVLERQGRRRKAA